MSFHLFNSAEAKPFVRLHPDKSENLHSNGDMDDYRMLSSFHYDYR